MPELSGRADELEPLLVEQLAYYRAVAGEYEDYAIPGPGGSELIAALESFRPSGRVLELACGTGVWTELLLRHATSVTAVDASAEMLAIASARVGDDRARFIQADLFTWAPDRRYDVVFFGFWLSHVPADRFAEFWSLIADCLVDGGRAVFVDEHVRSAEKETWLADEVVQRSLSDGSTHRVVKTYVDPPELTARLAELGWTADVTDIGSGWVLGEARHA
jgi:demethylmenaquinone methyltransferase/2-methoxy-6-polyprenyl-1,4-benzoquinol methylase